MIDEEAIRHRWESVGSRLDERGRRLFAAAEVRTAGWGGLAVVSRITGLARSTINRGEDDLDATPLPQGQVRRAGGGRKAVSEKDPGLVCELQRLVEPATLGDPLLAGARGARSLSTSQRADDHGRLRRLQRRARAAVEGRAAEACRCDAADAPRPPLSAGHVEMEPDRAPPVLPHHAELARPAADGSAGRGGADRCHHDQDRPQGRVRAR
jgi:hypothetical protein